MKKINLCLVTLVLLIFSMAFLFSCDNDEEVGLADASLLQVSTDTLRFVVNGGEERVGIRTLLTWNAISEADTWCIVKRTGSLLAVTAQSNKGKERVANVRVVAGDITKNLVVIQEGLQEGQSLVLSAKELDVNCVDMKMVGVKAIAPWTVKVPDQDTSWCKASKQEMGGVKVIVKGNEERSTQVEVIMSNEKRVFTVNQKKYDFTYEVGELYQDDNGEISGIIFGKWDNYVDVISILQGRATYMNPGDPDLKKKFGLNGDGEAALHYFQTNYPNDWHSRFPVIAWCYDLNERYETEGWYLISTGDFGNLTSAFGQLSAMNKIIEFYGGVPFIGGDNEDAAWLITCREEERWGTQGEGMLGQLILGQYKHRIDKAYLGGYIERATERACVRAVKRVAVPE